MHRDHRYSYSLLRSHAARRRALGPPADNELLYRTVLPEHHRALAAPEGVTGTVVVEASAWLADNQWILDLAA